MRRSAAFQSLLYSRDILGVDLGSHAVRVLRLRVKGRSVAVVDYAQREVWPMLAGAKSEHERRRVVAGVLRELVGGRRFTIKGAAASLSGNGMLIRFFDSSKPYKPDPFAPMPVEAASFAPFGAQETVISSRTQPSFPHRGVPKTEAMVVFAPKKLVDDGAAILRLAGLTPAVVVNDALALQSAYEHSLDRERHETVALVGAGASCTSVSIVENGHPRLVRVFNVAGAAFTRAVQRDLAVSLQEAEELKKRHGVSLRPEDEAGDGEAARVRRALRPVARGFAAEIRRTVDSFLDKRPASYPAPRAIVLTGGSADMPGLAEMLAADARIPVELFRPLESSPVSSLRVEIDPASSSNTVVYGLAVQSALRRNSSKQRFNMLSRRARRTGALTTLSLSVMIAAGAVVLAAAAWGAYSYKSRQMATSEATIEQALAAARAARDARPRRAAAPAAVKARKTESPFAYLSRLEVTGLMGGTGSPLAMLASGDAIYVAKSGKLYDENEAEVAGVTAEITVDSVILVTTRNEKFVIALPK